MLFTGEKILSGFKKHLEGATRIHIATAWATPGKALNELEAAVQRKEKKGKKGIKVRAIVGTYGNATEPSALDRLHEFGKLRLAGNEALFHPKVYIFEFKNRARRAWVGSANFTRPGFGGGNVEIVYETDDVEPFLGWFEEQWSQLKPATEEAIGAYRERRRRNPPSREFRKLVDEPEGSAPEPLFPPFARTGKWKPVLDPKEIIGAFNQMRATLIDETDELDRTVGRLNTVYWRADPGYWCAFGQRRHGHWIPFGPENPPQRSDRLGSGCLQINPPFDGNSKYAGLYDGLFVRNDGDIFLARRTEGISRVKSEDLERELNERLPGRVVDVPWKGSRRMVVLGEVGSGELRETVAELVRLVAELKAAPGD